MKSTHANSMPTMKHAGLHTFCRNLVNAKLTDFLARDSMLSALYAIANPSVRLSVRPSVRPSVCPSVTRVDQSKTVEARIMQFSPYSSPIPLVFAR